MSFKPASEYLVRAIVANIMGPRGSGKSDFALRDTPKPLALLSTDPTVMTILDKFDMENIQISTYDQISPELMKEVSGVKNREQIAASAESFRKVQEMASVIWSQYYKDYTDALSWARTIVQDTATESWEILRLARFGKLMEVPQHLYGAVNREYSGMIRMAQDKGVNLILLNKMKPVWGETVSASGQVRRGPTSELEMQGFSHLGYDITFEGQVYQNLCICRGKGKPHPGPCDGNSSNGGGSCECSSPCGADGMFHMKIMRCTQQPSLLYEDFAEPTFTQIAQMIYPDSTEEDWK